MDSYFNIIHSGKKVIKSVRNTSSNSLKRKLEGTPEDQQLPSTSQSGHKSSQLHNEKSIKKGNSFLSYNKMQYLFFLFQREK